MFRPWSLSGCLLAAFAAACGGAASAPPTASPRPAPPPPADSAAPAIAPPPSEAAGSGGMWMPEQLASRADDLRAHGLELPVEALGRPDAPPLAAVISLGGCTASFVSPEGLLVTNHHCATGALQYSSTPKENLLQTGFVAKTRPDEKSNGPASRVFVTQAFRDVTQAVQQGLAEIADDLARYETIERRKKELVASCEKDRPGIRCSVASYFGGAEHRLVEQLEIRDVRLVYAPDKGVGNFGGEIDNWRWPRHSGDFAMYRAYVGKDGKPADYAKDNVPYRPAHVLPLARTPLREGDLVLVAGYPGQTSRLKTADEVDEAVGWAYPRRLRLYDDYLALLEGLGKTSPETAIKATPLVRGLSNARTKVKGLQDGLVQGGLRARKIETEAALRRFIDADPARKAAYGDVLDAIAALGARRQKTRDHDAAVTEPIGLARLLSAAVTIVRMAEERPKPDEAREADYQARNWKRLEAEQVALAKRYDRKLDVALLRLASERAGRLPVETRPKALLDESGKPLEQAAIERMYAQTKLENEKTRLALLQRATSAELAKSSDPLIRLALAIRPAQKAADDREHAYAGAMALLRPRYVEALRLLSPGPIAPDANGTLRVTYGRVRGYRPTPEAPEHRPFTLLSEMAAKHRGEEPFDVPGRVLAAVESAASSPYLDPKLGEVPVDFLSGCDITGGNSGSPTLNAKGELVGLAFDGNYESMASDWLFMPEVTRTIHVDIRYALWVMDAADGADHLLREMGRAPAVD